LLENIRRKTFWRRIPDKCICGL